MLNEQILTNARIVTADQVFTGTVVLHDGLISDVQSGASCLPQAQNLEGDYLLPGLVELHTDNLEKHLSPRPGVDWPSASAVMSHDAQIIAAGITTVFDALSIGDVNPKGKRMQQLPGMVEAIARANAADITRAERSATPTPSACSATWWSSRWCNWCRPWTIRRVSVSSPLNPSTVSTTWASTT